MAPKLEVKQEFGVLIGHDIVPAGSKIATATTEEWVVLAADFELPKQLFATHDSRVTGQLRCLTRSKFQKIEEPYCICFCYCNLVGRNKVTPRGYQILYNCSAPL